MSKIWLRQAKSRGKNMLQIDQRCFQAVVNNWLWVSVYHGTRSSVAFWNQLFDSKQDAEIYGWLRYRWSVPKDKLCTDCLCHETRNAFLCKHRASFSMWGLGFQGKQPGLPGALACTVFMHCSFCSLYSSPAITLLMISWALKFTWKY